MILKQNTIVSANALARELEVSRRTVYRDIDALGLAEIPVYVQPGRNGVFGLLDDFDAGLSDLNEKDFLSVLVAAKLPQLNEVGIGSHIQSALRKLTTKAVEGPPLFRAQDVF